jgi:alpha/beta hydrolase family protein
MTTLFGDLAGDLTGEPGRTPPLVLLHGLTFDRTSWHPVLAELTALDLGRAVLALDLPGHGESPPWPGYDLEPIADAVHRDQTFENPKTGAVLETAFVYPDGTKGTDLYLSVSSRDTVPPNPYRR